LGALWTFCAISAPGQQQAIRIFHQGGDTLAKPNYEFEKRRRELEKKKKMEEKRQRKLEKAHAGDAAPEGASAETAPGVPAAPETGDGK
jgi:hypothetical protein